MRRIVLAALGCVIVAACGKAPQQTAEGPAPAPTAAAPDANGQGGPDQQGRGGRFGPQTLDQMLERSLARFDRADLNHDGKLTKDEIDQFQARREAARGDGQGGGQGGQGANAQGPGGRRGFGGGFARADLDGDGVVTRAEMEAQTRARFQSLDADGDGVVTPDELRAGFGGGQGGGGQGGPPAGGGAD